MVLGSKDIEYQQHKSNRNQSNFFEHRPDVSKRLTEKGKKEVEILRLCGRDKDRVKRPQVNHSKTQLLD